MSRVRDRSMAGVMAATILVALVPIVWAVMYVIDKHRWAEQHLAQLEPRHARLLGIIDQRAEIDAALERARQLRPLYVYPADQDATQTGNAVQQRLREILAGAGMQVRSAQVLPAKEEKGFDRISLTVSADGDLIGLHSALAVLASQTPTMVLQDLNVRVQGSLAAQKASANPRFTAQFNVSVLRARS